MTDQTDSNGDFETAAAEVWERLSKVSVNEHTELKGNLTYLSWAWAVQTMMEHFPTFHYDMHEVTWFPDCTAEVSCTVGVVHRGVSIQKGMWLPVMGNRNEAIQNPNSVQINKSKMRCLTKAISMLGLGAYIYAGEDLPSVAEEAAPAAPSADLQEKFVELKSLIANNACWELRKFREDNMDIMDNLFNMAESGKKTQFKQDCRDVYAASNEGLKDGLALCERMVGEGWSADAATEAWEEMEPLERHFIAKGMNEILSMQMTDLIGDLEEK